MALRASLVLLTFALPLLVVATPSAQAHTVRSGCYQPGDPRDFDPSQWAGLWLDAYIENLEPGDPGSAQNGLVWYNLPSFLCPFPPSQWGCPKNIEGCYPSFCFVQASNWSPGMQCDPDHYALPFCDRQTCAFREKEGCTDLSRSPLITLCIHDCPPPVPGEIQACIPKVDTPFVAFVCHRKANPGNQEDGDGCRDDGAGGYRFLDHEKYHFLNDAVDDALFSLLDPSGRVVLADCLAPGAFAGPWVASGIAPGYLVQWESGDKCGNPKGTWTTTKSVSLEVAPLISLT